MKESELYLFASIVSFVAFIICVYYVSKHKLFNFETTVIIILGLLSLSKSVEYYEKHDYKLTKKL